MIGTKHSNKVEQCVKIVIQNHHESLKEIVDLNLLYENVKFVPFVLTFWTWEAARFVSKNCCRKIQQSTEWCVENISKSNLRWTAFFSRVAQETITIWLNSQQRILSERHVCDCSFNKYCNECNRINSASTWYSNAPNSLKHLE